MSVIEEAVTIPAGATVAVDSPRRAAVVRGICFNWGSLVVGALVSILLTPIMIRGLGQYYYGMWVLVMSISDQYGLLDLGMTPALSRFAGYFQGSKDRSGADEMFCVAFFLTLLISLLICVLSGAAAGFLPAFFGIAPPNRTTFVRLILLLGLTTAFAFPERMLAAYLRGIQRFDLTSSAATGALVLRALLFLIALRLGCGIMAVALITLGMGVVTFGAHYLLIRWADPGLKIQFTNLSRARLRELFSFGIYAFIASLGTRLITRMDSIVIGRILSVGLIAPFNIASRLTDYFVGVFAGIHGPVLSAMSELDGASKRDELRMLFIRSSRYTILLSLLMGSLLLADGRMLLKLWLGSTGLDLDLTYRVLVILTFCYTANQAQLPSWSVIYARARHQLLAWLALCEGVANLGLSLYWGRRYGLVGVALGTAVPAVIHYVLISPWYALRVVEIPAGTYLKQSVVRPVLCILLFAGYCSAIGRYLPSALGIGLTILPQVITLSFLAYSVGLSGDDRQTVKRHLSKWFLLLLRR